MGTLFQVSGSPYSDWFEKRLWNKPPSTSVVSENAASPFGLRGSGKWLGNFSGLSNHMRVRRKYIKYFAAEQELNDTLCLMQTSTKHPFLLTFSRFIIKHHSSKCLQSLKEISSKYFNKKKKKKKKKMQEVFWPVFVLTLFFRKQVHGLNLPLQNAECHAAALYDSILSASNKVKVFFDSANMFIAGCNIFYLACFIINGCLCDSNEEESAQAFCQISVFLIYLFFVYHRLTKVKI